MNARQKRKNHWQGTVESVENGVMRVHVARSSRDWPGLILELPVSMLPMKDREMELQGAYLHIWFQPWDKLNVKMCRIPWTPKDAERCRERAKQFAALFNLESAKQPETVTQP